MDARLGKPTRYSIRFAWRADGVPTQPQANVQVLGSDNQPTKYSPGSGNACAPTPWEAVERTFINALTTGGALETATTTR